MDIRFQCVGVGKRYGEGKGGVQALDGVCLDLHDGEICALLGPSGSGKSTLARVLMGLTQHDSGSVLYKGKPLGHLDMREFRRQNQIMLQNPYLSVHPRYSVRKILAEPLIVNGRSRTQINEKIEFWRGILKLPATCLERTAEKLSTGQLQRVVLARALMLDPQFLILDEPFSSLDEILARKLLRFFARLLRRLHIGVLHISHHGSRIGDFVDRIVVLDGGRIVADRRLGDGIAAPAME